MGLLSQSHHLSGPQVSPRSNRGKSMNPALPGPAPWAAGSSWCGLCMKEGRKWVKHCSSVRMTGACAPPPMCACLRRGSSGKRLRLTSLPVPLSPVTSGKSLHLSEPPFSHLHSQGYLRCLPRSLKDSTEQYRSKSSEI